MEARNHHKPPLIIVINRNYGVLSCMSVHQTLVYTNCEQCYASVISLHVEIDIIIRVGGVYTSALEHCIVGERSPQNFEEVVLFSNSFSVFFSLK